MIDPGLLLCLLLSLFLVLPLALNPGLPDGAGLLRPPADGGLANLIAGFIQRLFNFSPIEAVRGLLLLCFALCSGGMYAFCKRRSGRLGALIAGLAYVYSPYLMVDSPYARGANSELLALALFPLLLWRVDDLRDKPKPASFLLVCLLHAALLSTRQETALALSGLVFAWLFVETLIQHFNREASQMRARSGALAALALLLGLLVSAPAWLPFEPLRAPQGLEFRGGFLYLEELLAPPPIQDAGASNSLRGLPNLGLAQWTLAGLGALTALRLYVGGYRTRHPQAFLGTAFFAGLAVLLIVLMQPAAIDLWSGSPLLRQLRAPSRLLGPTAACLAIVAGMNGLWLSRLPTRYQSGTIAILVASLIVTVIPLLYVPEQRPSPAPAAALSDAAGDIPALMSAGALLLAFALAWRLRAWQLRPRPYWTAPALSRTSVIGVLLGGAIALLSLLITFREGVAWINSPPGKALPAQVQRLAAISDSVQLLGYDLNAEAFSPGGRLVFTAYWYALERPTVDYASFLRLSAGGAPQLLTQKPHPAGRPSSELWAPEGYIIDAYDVLLPADLPLGEYQLIIGLTVCEQVSMEECAKRAPAHPAGENGEALGGSAVIAMIRVEAS